MTTLDKNIFKSVKKNKFMRVWVAQSVKLLTLGFCLVMISVWRSQGPETEPWVTHAQNSLLKTLSPSSSAPPLL